MLSLPILEPKRSLFEASLEPLPSVADKLRSDTNIDEAEINVIRGKKNKVAVGEPHYENLISILKDQNHEVPREIKNMANSYDFVRLSCTFVPDKDCRFEWARFGVDLSTESSVLYWPKTLLVIM